MDLRSDMFDHVAKLSLTFHDERHTGQLMSLINMQAAAIGAIVMAFPPIFESFLMLIGMLDDRAADRLAGDARLAGLRAVHLLGDWACTAPASCRASGGAEPRVAVAVDRLRGDVDAAGDRRRSAASGYEHYRFTTQGRTAVDARVRLTVWQTLFSLGVTTAIALGTALVLGFGAWHVLQGNITLGELTVLIAYIAADLPAARVDQPDDRQPAPAASCS